MKQATKALVSQFVHDLHQVAAGDGVVNGDEGPNPSSPPSLLVRLGNTLSQWWGSGHRVNGGEGVSAAGFLAGARQADVLRSIKYTAALVRARATSVSRSAGAADDMVWGEAAKLIGVHLQNADIEPLRNVGKKRRRRKVIIFQFILLLQIHIPIVS